MSTRALASLVIAGLVTGACAPTPPPSPSPSPSPLPSQAPPSPIPTGTLHLSATDRFVSAAGSLELIAIIQNDAGQTVANPGRVPGSLDVSIATGSYRLIGLTRFVGIGGPGPIDGRCESPFIIRPARTTTLTVALLFQEDCTIAVS